MCVRVCLCECGWMLWHHEEKPAVFFFFFYRADYIERTLAFVFCSLCHFLCLFSQRGRNCTNWPQISSAAYPHACTTFKVKAIDISGFSVLWMMWKSFARWRAKNAHQDVGGHVSSYWSWVDDQKLSVHPYYYVLSLLPLTENECERYNDEK